LPIDAHTSTHTHKNENTKHKPQNPKTPKPQNPEYNVLY
jgi:hypothetical protein